MIKTLLIIYIVIALILCAGLLLFVRQDNFMSILKENNESISNIDWTSGFVTFVLCALSIFWIITIPIIIIDRVKNKKIQS